MDKPMYVYAVVYNYKTECRDLPILFARKEDAEEDVREQAAMGRDYFEVIELEVF